MPNILGLKDWKVIDHEQSSTDMRVTAEYTPAPPFCPRCGVENPPLYKHDVRMQEFMDTPNQGLRVTLIVRRQRFHCQSCEKTFQQLLPDMDEGRNMTKRLADFIKRLSLDRKFTDISHEVGLDEKTIRNLFREYVEKLESERILIAPEWLGIDELHLLSDYRCMLTDPDGLASTSECGSNFAIGGPSQKHIPNLIARFFGHVRISAKDSSGGIVTQAGLAEAHSVSVARFYAATFDRSITAATGTLVYQCQ